MNSLQLAYARISTKAQSTDSQITEIEQAYPDATIYSEIISGTVPANEREQLSKVMLQLRKGDTLIVWWIDRLGRDYHDAENTIRALLERGVTIKTINQNLTFAYTGNDMQDMTTNIQITMIAAMAAAERKNRLASAQAGRNALRVEGATNKKGKTWSEAFAGRKTNQELHDKIKECLSDGMSIRKTAEQCECSTATVQKVKKDMTN